MPGSGVVCRLTDSRKMSKIRAKCSGDDTIGYGVWSAVHATVLVLQGYTYIRSKYMLKRYFVPGTYGVSFEKSTTSKDAPLKIEARDAVAL